MGPQAADFMCYRRRHARVSEFTRESLAIETGISFRSERVCSVLEGLIGSRGVPAALRMDNGLEFVALALRGLCHRRGIDPAYIEIEPGKPWQNGFAESFHARLRDEFLDGEAFLSVLEAQVRLDLWRRYSNEERPHSSVDYRERRRSLRSSGPGKRVKIRPRPRRLVDLTTGADQTGESRSFR